MDGRVIIAVGLLGQMVPIAYTGYKAVEKREADPAFFQTYSAGSTSFNFDCKHGGCGGGGKERYGQIEALSQLPPVAYIEHGKREASPDYSNGKREASHDCNIRRCPLPRGQGKREASPNYGRNGKSDASPDYGLITPLHGKSEASANFGYRQGKREAQYNQKFNDAATFQNFDCNTSSGCRVVSSNAPSPVGNNPETSLPQSVINPPRIVVASLPTRVTNPTRKVVTNQQTSFISRPTVTNLPQSVISDYQSASDECKCDLSQMIVFVGFDDYKCSSISTSKDESVCFYKNSSDEDAACKCG